MSSPFFLGCHEYHSSVCLPSLSWWHGWAKSNLIADYWYFSKNISNSFLALENLITRLCLSLLSNVSLLLHMFLPFRNVWRYTNLPLSRMPNKLLPLPGRMGSSRHPSPNTLLLQVLHPWCHDHDNRLVYDTRNSPALLAESWKEGPSLCPLKIRRLFLLWEQ